MHPAQMNKSLLLLAGMALMGLLGTALERVAPAHFSHRLTAYSQPK